MNFLERSFGRAPRPDTPGNVRTHQQAPSNSRGRQRGVPILCQRPARSGASYRFAARACAPKSKTKAGLGGVTLDNVSPLFIGASGHVRAVLPRVRERLPGCRRRCSRCGSRASGGTNAEVQQRGSASTRSPRQGLLPVFEWQLRVRQGRYRDSRGALANRLARVRRACLRWP